MCVKKSLIFILLTSSNKIKRNVFLKYEDHDMCTEVLIVDRIFYCILRVNYVFAEYRLGRK